MLSKNVSEQDRHQLMLYLGRMYRSSTLKNKRHSMYEIHEDTSHYINLEVAYEFDQILYGMEAFEREILMNDYLLPKAPGWWKNKYAKTAYLQHKSTAITTFLDCLYT